MISRLPWAAVVSSGRWLGIAMLGIAVCTGGATADSVPRAEGDAITQLNRSTPHLAGERIDSDADGLSDEREAEIGTDPSNPDTDGDHLPDGREVNVYGTNPVASDTDKDGLPDGRELNLGINPKVADTDGDGVSDRRERNLGTNPRLVDSDKDGLSDGIEAAGATNVATLVTDRRSVPGFHLSGGNYTSVLLIGDLRLTAIALAGGLTVAVWGGWRWYRRTTSPIIVKVE